MAKQIAFNLVSGVCNTIRHNPGVMSPSNVITPPHRLRFAQTAFMVVLPRTITKYPHETSSEDLENKR